MNNRQYNKGPKTYTHSEFCPATEANNDGFDTGGMESVGVRQISTQ